MKKTISIHIKGFPFIMEEDAYELLKSYLHKIENQLKNNQDCQEIISDIEYRIAELCQLIIEKKQVIEIHEIQKILDTLGKPEDFGVYSDEKNENEGEKSDSRNEKRLYRDMDEAKIAGVCSGISNYFGIDVLLIRLIFILILLFAGFGIPMYIILWIVIPKATNTVDRLKMYGKPITLDNLKVEVENAAEKVKQQSNSFIKEIKEDVRYQKRFSELGNLGRKLISFFLFFIGFSLLIAFVVLFLGFLNVIPIESNFENIHLSDLNTAFFSNSDDGLWLFGGVFLFSFSIILLLLSNAVYLFWNIKNKWKKVVNLLLTTIHVFGIVFCVIAASHISTYFRSYAKLEVQNLTVDTETLQIHCKQNKYYRNFKIKEGSGIPFLKLKNDSIAIHHIDIQYRKSTDSLFHLTQVFSSNGSSFDQAKRNASHIHQGYSLQEHTLLLQEKYSFPLSDKIRNQKTTWIIEIPESKTLIFNGKKVKKEDY